MVTPLLNRREFISTTAAAGAGLMLASGAKAFGQGPAANSKLNIALIGFGAQGRVLLLVGEQPAQVLPGPAPPTG